VAVVAVSPTLAVALCTIVPLLNETAYQLSVPPAPTPPRRKPSCVGESTLPRIISCATPVVNVPRL
jgi:hypothetical protein